MAQLPDPENIDPAALARSYTSGEIDLICVLGPTASGKTRYAVSLVKALRRETPGQAGGDVMAGSDRSSPEIISADSRQVYVGMDIGTGKDLKEYGDVPYHLIDIAPAGSKFNIYQYQAAFADAWAAVRAKDAIPILTSNRPPAPTSSKRRTAFRRSVSRSTYIISARLFPAKNGWHASTGAWKSACRRAWWKRSEACWTVASRPMTSSTTALNINLLRSSSSAKYHMKIW